MIPLQKDEFECIYRRLLEVWHAGEWRPEYRLTALTRLEELQSCAATSDSAEQLLTTLQIQAATWCLDLGRKPEAADWLAKVSLTPGAGEAERWGSDKQGDRNGRFDDKLRHRYNEVEERLLKGKDHAKKCCPRCGNLNVASLAELRSNRKWWRYPYGWLRSRSNPLDERWWPYDPRVEDEERMFADRLAACSVQTSHRRHARLFGRRFLTRVCFRGVIKETRGRVCFCRDCKTYFGRTPGGDHEDWQPKSSDGGFMTRYPRPKGLSWGQCPACCREIIEPFGLAQPDSGAKTTILCQSCGSEAGGPRCYSWGRDPWEESHWDTERGVIKNLLSEGMTKLARLPLAIVMALTSWRVIKTAFWASLVIVGGSIIGMELWNGYRASLLMKPFDATITGLANVRDFGLVNPETMGDYRCRVWAGITAEDRKADLRKFVHKVFSVYSNLDTIKVNCVEVPARNPQEWNEIRDKVIEWEKQPCWTETFHRREVSGGGN